MRKRTCGYRHQGFELTVPRPAGPVDATGLAAAIAAFYHRHERLCTFAQEETPVEGLGVHVESETRGDFRISYLALAKRHHPDRNPGAAELMAKINAARTAILNSYPNFSS